ncbi:hypothetical protein HYH03_009329 [Edaphochlamys debaryana]|uniref:Protein kinase domain-containing protein n=1 Tax=Edaphochlamys debaryana TaxID=47281 RepID=A0A835Y1J4_9CHLO|nr:hypothetical protein HYH03_009329 [Edaphochlamys debaryana]|eukprot:KAG2492381.1 hypothetical protein HYH03_009329 [Edaphochlamys debaryana]
MRAFSELTITNNSYVTAAFGAVTQAVAQSPRSQDGWDTWSWDAARPCRAQSYVISDESLFQTADRPCNFTLSSVCTDRDTALRAGFAPEQLSDAWVGRIEAARAAPSPHGLGASESGLRLVQSELVIGNPAGCPASGCSWYDGTQQFWSQGPVVSLLWRSATDDTNRLAGLLPIHEGAQGAVWPLLISNAGIASQPGFMGEASDSGWQGANVGPWSDYVVRVEGCMRDYGVERLLLTTRSGSQQAVGREDCTHWFVEEAPAGGYLAALQGWHGKADLGEVSGSGTTLHQLRLVWATADPAAAPSTYVSRMPQASGAACAAARPELRIMPFTSQLFECGPSSGYACSSNTCCGDTMIGPGQQPFLLCGRALGPCQVTCRPGWGYCGNPPEQSSALFVSRLPASAPASSFSAAAAAASGGVVTGSGKRLLFNANLQRAMQYKEAMQYCGALTTLGLTWRLAELEDLMALATSIELRAKPWADLFVAKRQMWVTTDPTYVAMAPEYACLRVFLTTTFPGKSFATNAATPVHAVVPATCTAASYAVCAADPDVPTTRAGVPATPPTFKPGWAVLTVSRVLGAGSSGSACNFQSMASIPRPTTDGTPASAASPPPAFPPAGNASAAAPAPDPNALDPASTQLMAYLTLPISAVRLSVAGTLGVEPMGNTEQVAAIQLILSGVAEEPQGLPSTAGWLTFDLAANESITAISGCSGGFLERLVLHTSAGRRLGPPVTRSSVCSSPFLEVAPPGGYLVGVQGVKGYYIEQLQAVWAAPYASPPPSPPPFVGGVIPTANGTDSGGSSGGSGLSTGAVVGIAVGAGAATLALLGAAAAAVAVARKRRRSSSGGGGDVAAGKRDDSAAAMAEAGGPGGPGGGAGGAGPEAGNGAVGMELCSAPSGSERAPLRLRPSLSSAAGGGLNDSAEGHEPHPHPGSPTGRNGAETTSAVLRPSREGPHSPGPAGASTASASASVSVSALAGAPPAPTSFGSTPASSCGGGARVRPMLPIAAQLSSMRARSQAEGTGEASLVSNGMTDPELSMYGSRAAEVLAERHGHFDRPPQNTATPEEQRHIASWSADANLEEPDSALGRSPVPAPAGLAPVLSSDAEGHDVDSFDAPPPDPAALAAAAVLAAPLPDAEPMGPKARSGSVAQAMVAAAAARAALGTRTTSGTHLRGGGARAGTQAARVTAMLLPAASPRSQAAEVNRVVTARSFGVLGPQGAEASARRTASLSIDGPGCGPVVHARSFGGPSHPGSHLADVVWVPPRGDEEAEAEELASDPMLNLVPGRDVDVDTGSYLGHGASGVVRRGVLHTPQGDMPVAVKLLQMPDQSEEEAGMHAMQIKGLAQEIRVLSRLHHPNIVRFLGACPDPIFIVTELMVTSLSKLLYAKSRTTGEFTFEYGLMDILRISRDMAAGLSYLHPTVVHRDLKPGNVLLDERGVAKLGDFGLARFKANTALTTRDVEVGTAPYMAPEVFISDEEAGTKVGDRSDVYSLGILINELCTRQRPWEGLRPVVIGFKVAMEKKRPPLPPPDHPLCPPRLRSLIEQCLRHNALTRPSSSEIHKRLTLLMAETEGPPPAMQASPARPGLLSSSSSVHAAPNSGWRGRAFTRSGSGSGNRSRPNSGHTLNIAGGPSRSTLGGAVGGTPRSFQRGSEGTAIGAGSGARAMSDQDRVSDKGAPFDAGVAVAQVQGRGPVSGAAASASGGDTPRMARTVRGDVG